MSEYPKWIDHPTEVDRVTKDGTNVPARVLVQDAKEEAKFLGKVKEEEKEEKKEEQPKKGFGPKS